MSILVLVITTSMGFCAPTVTITNCSDNYSDNAGPPFTRTFTRTCDVNVTVDGQVDLQAVVYDLHSTTHKNSGNGSDINYTTRSRFKVAGPLQGGTPVNVPSSAGASVAVQNNIDSNTTFSITTSYVTYEADYGDTNYTQDYTVQIYDSLGSTGYGTASDSRTFTIVNKAYINVSAAPTITYAGSSEVFNPAGIKESNNLTVTVKANNTWEFQVKLSRAPKDDATLEEITLTNNYFKCAGAGFNNDASSYTQFATADTYVRGAHNTDLEYITGDDGSGNLQGKSITVTFKVNNEATAYAKSTYTSQATFNVQYPDI